MIFDESYDKALWLILNSDENISDELVCFINSLTDEMYECIHSFINDYYDDDKMLVSHRQILGNNFWLRVEIHDDELTIRLHNWDNGKDYFREEKIELSLMPLCDEQLRSMQMHEQTCVGNFCREENIKFASGDYKTYDDVDYFITKRIGGYYVDLVNPYIDYYINSKKINIKSIPNKIYPHQFKNQKRLNRLIRTRRKK